MAVPTGDDDDDEGTFDAVKYHEDKEKRTRGRKRKQQPDVYTPGQYLKRLHVLKTWVIGDVILTVRHSYLEHLYTPASTRIKPCVKVNLGLLVL